MSRSHRPTPAPCTGPLPPALALALLLAPAPGRATPLDYLPVGDPLESELRVLDLLRGRGASDPYRLRHLHTRPLSISEIRPTPLHVDAAGKAVPPDDTTRFAPSAERAISNERLLRWISRDVPRVVVAADGSASTERLPGTSGRLHSASFSDDASTPSRVDLSAGLEGRAEVNSDTSRFASGSGLHARIGVQVDRWLAFSNLEVAQVDGARGFTDPVVAGSDVIAHTEESYLAYLGASGRWGAQFGRSRWHWGPGEEASLVLSKTSPAITALALRGSIPEYGLDLSTLSATLAGSAGEQLAVHRVEWQPADDLRLGITEAARYHAGGWRAPYFVGVIPYVLVQRLEAQDEPDSAAALKSDVMASLDVAWRVAEGTRVYGELLVDELHTRESSAPNQLAWQLGLEGVGAAFGRRLTWGTECTRLSRFVYTDRGGRTFESQGQPLGFPTGPDALRLRARGAVDMGPDWQLLARATQTDKGENDLNEPYVPGTPGPEVWEFEGVRERTRDLEAGVRWWPASGVDIAVIGGWTRVENVGHVNGAEDDRVSAALELRLVR